MKEKFRTGALESGGFSEPVSDCRVHQGLEAYAAVALCPSPVFVRVLEVVRHRVPGQPSVHLLFLFLVFEHLVLPVVVVVVRRFLVFVEAREVNGFEIIVEKVAKAQSSGFEKLGNCRGTDGGAGAQGRPRCRLVDEVVQPGPVDISDFPMRRSVRRPSKNLQRLAVVVLVPFETSVEDRGAGCGREARSLDGRLHGLASHATRPRRDRSDRVENFPTRRGVLVEAKNGPRPRQSDQYFHEIAFGLVAFDDGRSGLCGEVEIWAAQQLPESGRTFLTRPPQYSMPLLATLPPLHLLYGLTKRKNKPKKRMLFERVRQRRARHLLRREEAIVLVSVAEKELVVSLLEKQKYYRGTFDESVVVGVLRDEANLESPNDHSLLSPYLETALCGRPPQLEEGASLRFFVDDHSSFVLSPKFVSEVPESLLDDVATNLASEESRETRRPREEQTFAGTFREHTKVRKLKR